MLTQNEKEENLPLFFFPLFHFFQNGRGENKAKMAHGSHKHLPKSILFPLLSLIILLKRALL